MHPGNLGAQSGRVSGRDLSGKRKCTCSRAADRRIPQPRSTAIGKRPDFGNGNDPTGQTRSTMRYAVWPDAAPNCTWRSNDDPSRETWLPTPSSQHPGTKRGPALLQNGETMKCKLRKHPFTTPHDWQNDRSIRDPQVRPPRPWISFTTERTLAQ